MHLTSDMTRPARDPAGFTLIELVVVVAIVAILAAVGVPSFMDQVRKARRADAMEALTDLANRQERYYSTNFRYTSDLTELGYSSSTGTATSPDGHYSLTLTSNGTTYTIKAQATGSQAADTRCNSFTISETGERTASSEPPPDGGLAPETTAACWRD